MSKNTNQRSVIHPKLRGKLENWQRNQAALANAEEQKQTGSGGEGAGDTKCAGKQMAILNDSYPLYLALDLLIVYAYVIEMLQVNTIHATLC